MAKDLGVIVVILIGGAYLVRAALPPRRRREDARGLHRDRAAARGRHRDARRLGGAVDVARRFHGRRLLSDSEYRHELQADIEPFEGLLLGFFFISVGMSANLGLAYHNAALVAVSLLVLLAAKIAVAFAVDWLKRRNAKTALRFSLALPRRQRVQLRPVRRRG